MARYPSHRPRGFTLIEMALSLSLVGIVLVALGSMLALTMQSAPQPTDAASRVRGIAFPASVMAEEIGSATGFVSVTTREIEFRIADRTGDDTEETVIYSWSGTPGDPLLRTINGGTDQVMVDSVQGVAFSAETDTHTLVEKYPGPGTTFVRELTPGFSHLPGVVVMLNSRMVPIDHDEGFFQRIPGDRVPGDALYWVPEYVQVRMAQHSTPGAVRLEVRTVDDGSPTGVAVASKVILADDIDDDEEWVQIDVPGSLKLPADTTLGVAVICIYGHRSVETRVFEQFVFPSEPAMLRSSDGGDSWSGSLSTRLSYRIRGEYYPESKEETITETTVSTVRFSINPSELDYTGISTTVDLPTPVRMDP